MDGSQSRQPEDLGLVEEIDSFGLEPGVILLDRFCALAPATRIANGWSVPVTDLRRALGRDPHHRLSLDFVSSSDISAEKLQARLAVTSTVLPRIYARVHTPQGILFLTEPVEGPVLASPLPPAELLSVAIPLAGALAEFHRAGVSGIDFSPDCLHGAGAQTRVAGLDHLIATGTPEEDVQRLIELLSLLSGGDLQARLRPRPNNAVELWDRLKALRAGQQHPKRPVLPTLAPFVGRTQQTAVLMEAARSARKGNPRVIMVRGGAGVGKTKLLTRLSIEIDRWMDATVLTGTFEQGVNPLSGGIVQALGRLASRAARLTAPQQEAARRRILEATDPLHGVVAALSPQIAGFLGRDETPPTVALEQRFNRHAAVIATAIRAIGTAERPLLLLLDDVDGADPGSLAILRELRNGPDQHHTLVVATYSDADSFDGHAYGKDLIELEPFTSAEVEQLCRKVLPEDEAEIERLVETLYRTARGDPTMTWASLRDWAMHSEAGDELDLPVPTQRGPADLFLRQYRTLRPHHQWLLTLVAYREGVASETWLTQVTAWNHTEVKNAVSHVAETGLLVVEPDGALRLPGAQIRQLIQDQTDEETQLQAHQRIAEWLETDVVGASDTQLAFHQELSRGPGRDEPLAQRHVRAGLEFMRIYNLERALWHFDKALGRTRKPGTWVDAHAARADAYLLQGRTQEALDDYLDAMSVDGDPIRGLETAASAIHAFYRQASGDGHLKVATAALALAHEPIPRTPLGVVVAIVWAAIALLLRLPSRQTKRARHHLARVYTTLVAAVAGERPQLAALGILRGYRHAQGLETANGVAMTSMYAAFRQGMGHADAADRILNEAQIVGDRSDDPWGSAVVHHVRAQNLYSRGDYEAADRSVELALEAFRKTGDESVSVLTRTLRLLYGRERQPLAESLKQALDIQHSCQRQQHELGNLGARSLRLYLLARADAEVLSELHTFSEYLWQQEGVTTELGTSHAYTALAWMEAGDLVRARSHATESIRRFDGTLGALEFHYDAVIAEVATLLALPAPGGEDRRSLHRALRRLRRAARLSPRLGAANALYQGLAARTTGHATRAIALFQQVIDDLPQHGQLYYAVLAHDELAGLSRGTDPAGVQRHRFEATELRARLGLGGEAVAESGAEIDLATPRPAPQAAPGHALSLTSLVNRLRPALEPALPRSVPLEVDIAEDAMVSGSAEALQLLIVNMVLAARDALGRRGQILIRARNLALDVHKSAQMPRTGAQATVLIEVHAKGFDTQNRTISGLGICCEIAASIGGFVDVQQINNDTMVLGAYLGVTEEDRNVVPLRVAQEALEAMVVHSNASVRQTLVSTLGSLGYRAEGIDPALDLDQPSVRLAFVEAGLPIRSDLAEASVLVAPRGSAPRGDLPVLSVPFTLSELEKVIEAALKSSDRA